MATHDEDFARWCHNQATRLREIEGVGHVLLPGIDVANVAEEIESWARHQLHEATRFAEEVVATTLALSRRKDLPWGVFEYWDDRQNIARDWLAAQIDQSPSLRPRLESQMGAINPAGHIQAELLFCLAGLQPPEFAPPGFTLADLLMEANP
ncbi:DUF29 family protein [Thiohalorhabdus methylotrophus]|uniref:DUF29 family protein n=1 Tax=Thiohalorhabdus methylotrophus TaxID=3242694 RepID=A0ABV4TZ95_9GAMM